MTDELFVNKYLDDNFVLVTNGSVFVVLDEKNSELFEIENFNWNMIKILSKSATPYIFNWVNDNKGKALSKFNDSLYGLDINLPIEDLLLALTKPITSPENYKLLYYLFAKILLSLKVPVFLTNFRLELGRTNWELVDIRTNIRVDCAKVLFLEFKDLFALNNGHVMAIYDSWYDKKVQEHTNKIMNISY